MRQALSLAEDSGIDRGGIRACMNLGYLLGLAGGLSESLEAIEHGLALARRRGDRVWERSLLTNLISSYSALGRWDEAEGAAAEIPEEGAIVTDPVQASAHLELATIALRRGENGRAAELAAPYTSWRESARVQARNIGVWARSLAAMASVRQADAVAECTAALEDEQMLRAPESVERLAEVGCEAAWTDRDVEGLTAILELVAAAPNEMHPSLAARIDLQHARVEVLRGGLEPPFDRSVAAFRRTGEPYWVATTLLEQAEWLADQGWSDEIEPLVAEAREVFERLRAAPALERIARLEPEAAVV
jgi:hypothetical protein